MLLPYACSILARCLEIIARPATAGCSAPAWASIALRHARWGGLTEAEKASATAQLREVAGDRGDLLAEVAGLALGSAENKGPEYEARGRAAAELCRMAGADEALIPQWTAEGRRRAEAAQLPPFSRPGRPPRRP